MTRPETGRDHDAARIADRSALLPEENAVGSADREEQAAAILAESDERVVHPESDARESKQTVPVTETQDG